MKQSKGHAELVRCIADMASAGFKDRAERYDIETVFPHENIQDLRDAGMMAAPVDPALGGLGLNGEYGGLYTLWTMTREIAKVDLSFARCWEGHNNALMVLNGLATQSQKQRWFSELHETDVCWAAWSGEPQTMVPGQKAKVGTHLQRVSDGYVLTGNKLFATSAPGASHALLLVSLAGPGGAREASDGGRSVLLLACNLRDASVSFDDSWWDPIGMRSTVSYKVEFNDTFIPDSDCIGEVGAYISEGYQTMFTPHYAASFIGAAEGAFEFALEYIKSQGKQSDPYVQQHVARMHMNIDTVDLWLQRVAECGHTVDKSPDARTSAQSDASKIRYLSELLAEDCVKRCIKVCGARSLNKPSRLERAYRDLSMYVLHDNADHVLATIGRGILGLPTDEAFFRLKG